MTTYYVLKGDPKLNAPATGRIPIEQAPEYARVPLPTDPVRLQTRIASRAILIMQDFPRLFGLTDWRDVHAWTIPGLGALTPPAVRFVDFSLARWSDFLRHAGEGSSDYWGWLVAEYKRPAGQADTRTGSFWKYVHGVLPSRGLPLAMLETRIYQADPWLHRAVYESYGWTWQTPVDPGAVAGAVAQQQQSTQATSAGSALVAFDEGPGGQLVESVQTGVSAAGGLLETAGEAVQSGLRGLGTGLEGLGLSARYVPWIIGGVAAIALWAYFSGGRRSPSPPMGRL